MGLFKKMLGTTIDPHSLSQAEALAAIAVAAVAADGYLLDEERERLFSLISTLQIFKGYSEQRRLKLLEKLFELLRQKGGLSLVYFAKDAIPPQLRETAFGVATEIVLSDGVLTFKEKEFLQHLQETLEIPDSHASRTVKFMLLKNKIAQNFS